MSKYVSLSAVEWALKQLKDSCDRTFVDLLIVKREGLAPKHPITITSSSTLDSASRIMGVTQSDGSTVGRDFFNPFAWKWLKAGYPRFGTYTTLERVTFRPIVNTARTADGMLVTLANGYIKTVQEKLRRSKDQELQVPLAALAIWIRRYDELPNDISAAKLVAQVAEELHLTQPELKGFFDTTATAPAFTSPSPLDKDQLANLLTALEPLEEAAAEGGELESVVEALPEDLIEYLRGDLLLPEELLRQLVTLLRAGKHIILTGPPGTGKSTLAARLADVSEKYSAQFSFPASQGRVFTTATADWTTFDTLGGYMPSATGQLSFQEGLFLQALRENRWLVIDELNRADVDKAFGQLFTVLSGHSVVLPYQRSGHNVAIEFDRGSANSQYTEANATYSVGQDWRIIATMNTFDRNLLFQLSAAFVRRFAVVHVGIPPKDELVDWIAARGLSERELALVSSLVDLLDGVRPLGPAIWDDLVQYMGMRTTHSFGPDGASLSAEASFVDAVTAYVLPQLDGLNQEDLGQVEGGIAELLENDGEKSRLGRSFKDMF